MISMFFFDAEGNFLSVPNKWAERTAITRDWRPLLYLTFCSYIDIFLYKEKSGNFENGCQWDPCVDLRCLDFELDVRNTSPNLDPRLSLHAKERMSGSRMYFPQNAF